MSDGARPKEMTMREEDRITSAVESKINGARKRSAFDSKRAGAPYVRLLPHALLPNHVFELRHPGDSRYRQPSRAAFAAMSCVNMA
jgi:hypothetical protein